MAKPIEILLIEDSPIDIRITQEALEKAKIRNSLHVITDGEDAMSFLFQRGKYANVPHPDLILLDLNLPKKDGREVLREIKSDKNLKHIPVVIMTISKFEEDILRSYELHANRYIIKDIDFDRFAKSIKAIEDCGFNKENLESNCGRNKIKIVLIEDNPGDARLIEEMLKEFGDDNFELEHVNSLTAGLKRIAEGGFQVILLDLGLPESQGLSTLDKILLHRVTIPIVVLTGSIADEQVGVMAVQKGAQDYLTKGMLDGKLLVRSIRYAIERKRTEEMLLKNDKELREQRDHLKLLAGQLSAVNKELEAFSFTVSHDLNAPLHRIMGFSEILLKDYINKLDEKGKYYLQRIIVAGQQMGFLINDLLNFARVSHREMHHKKVNLSALAKTIAEELQETQPERHVEFVIAEGLVTQGDPQLLRLVLVNLLGNAWKYTRNRPGARIEFGEMQHDGNLVYFVRDNGIGFDMSLYDRLFNAFQRLHSSDEYEGTGIGLATVQRIIHRHGGQIWGEGAAGKGATFYFTLNIIEKSQV